MVKHEFLFSKERATGLIRTKIDAVTNGDNTLVAAVAGKILRVYQVVLVADAACTVRFESGTGGTALTGQMSLANNVGFSSGWNPVGHFETAEGQLLNLEIVGAATVDGWLVYAGI